MEKNTEIYKRDISLDLIRIIACFFVIFNHTNDKGFYHYLDVTSKLYPFNVTLSILCKCAVPLFFMISGALLLKKDEPLKDTFKRIFKIVLDLVIFTTIYMWYDAYLAGKTLNILQVLKLIVTSNYLHLWYLYSYIGFLLSLPLFRKLIKGLTSKNESIYIYIYNITGFASIRNSTNY